MQNSVLLDRGELLRAGREQPDNSDCEASEVAALLLRAGIDHASALWFQLLELATQQACDWAERATESAAPLSPRAAAVLGLRSLAADLLSSTPDTPDQDEAPRAAAEACLAVCAEAEANAARTPPRRRRWGEGAIPQPPQRPGLLQRTVGCC